MVKYDCKKIINFIEQFDAKRLNKAEMNPDSAGKLEKAEKLRVALKRIAIDVMLEKLKPKIEFINQDENKSFRLCCDWQPLLLKSTEIYFESMDFAEKFRSEEDHLKKICLFDWYLRKSGSEYFHQNTISILKLC